MNPPPLAVLQTSAALATCVVLVCLLPSVWLAALPRLRRQRGSAWLDVMVLWPLSLSPAIVGLAFAAWWKSQALPGVRPDPLDGGVLLVLASSVLVLPLMTRTLRPALERHPPEAGHPLRTLGATRWAAWWCLNGRALAHALVAATALGWAAAWGEAGAVLVLAAAFGPEVLPPTLGLSLAAVWPLSTAELAAHDTLGLWAACGVGVALVATALAEWTRRKLAP